VPVGPDVLGCRGADESAVFPRNRGLCRGNRVLHGPADPRCLGVNDSELVCISPLRVCKALWEDNSHTLGSPHVEENGPKAGACGTARESEDLVVDLEVLDEGHVLRQNYVIQTGKGRVKVEAPRRCVLDKGSEPNGSVALAHSE